MTPKMGIENFKAVFLVVLAMINIGDKMGHKNNWAERMSVLFGLIPTLMTLGTINWSEVFPEFKDIDADERLILVDLTKENLDLEDDNIENAVEKAISMTNRLVGMVVEIIDFVKSIRSLFKK